jgi:hypothetical protein
MPFDINLLCHRISTSAELWFYGVSSCLSGGKSNLGGDLVFRVKVCAAVADIESGHCEKFTALTEFNQHRATGRGRAGQKAGPQPPISLSGRIGTSGADV